MIVSILIRWRYFLLAIVLIGFLLPQRMVTGNAKGKPPHLHYSIITLFPYLWRVDRSEQGWKKMFYLNPIAYLAKK